MKEITTFDYNGSPISFNRGDSVMVNATEMAKPFGKRPVDWLNLPSTKEFIEQLSIVRKSNNCDFQAFTTVRGSSENGGGTWMHEDIALEFARWLSPVFAIWCNDRIKELFTKGQTSLLSDDEKVLCAMTILQKRVNLLKAQNEEQTKQIEEMKPKVQVAETMAASKYSVYVADFAKMLHSKGVTLTLIRDGKPKVVKCGRDNLFEWFRQNKVMGMFHPYHNRPINRFVDYFEVNEGCTERGSISILTFTAKINPKGQEYFIQRLAHGVEQPTLF